MSMLTHFLKNGIELLFSVTGDYGISIVCATILLRALLVPLDVSQRKQMRKQKEISKRIDTIKCRYKNDQK